MYPPILRVHLKKNTSAKDVTNDAYATFSGACVCEFSQFFFIKAYVVGLI